MPTVVVHLQRWATITVTCLNSLIFLKPPANLHELHA